MIPEEIDWTVPPDPQEIEQLRQVALLPMSEKLEWLEQMQRMVEFMRRQSDQPHDQLASEQKNDHDESRR